MKSIKSVCFFGLIIFLTGIFLNPFASADLIDPYSGEKSIMLSYRISNMEMYDTYMFFLYGNIIGYQNLSLNQTISFYKFEQPSIYAVHVSEFTETKILDNESMMNEFFKNSSKVIKSNIKLSAIYGMLPKNHPLKSAQIILTITSIDKNSLNIKKSKIIFKYSDGTTEEKQIISQNTLPQPSRSALLPYWFESLWFIWIPSFAGIGITSILMYRKRIKKPQ